MKKLVVFISLLAGISACNEAQIDQICYPTLSRQFNAVYNAHYEGELQLDLSNLCDTATVFFTDLDATTVLPGEFKSFTVQKGIQYVVETSCADSTLTYQYVNKCP